MKLATVALIPAFAGFLGAQTEERQTTTTTTTKPVTMSGTLVDRGCYTTRTQDRETRGNTTTETTKVVTECPATTSTTTFGLLTPEGKFVGFDDDGNTRVVEMIKSKREWRDYIAGRKPVTVHVVGTRNGDVMVIKEIR